MSAPLSLIPTTAPTPTTPLGGGIGIMGTGSGLFGHILKLDTSAPTTPDTQTNVTLKGNTGFSLDPAMLVLPQELSSLSPEDLQNLLAQFANGEENILNNKILESLTPGIPSKELFANLPLKKDGVFVSSLNPEYSNVPTPVGDDNILLVASGLTPSTMQEFKNTIQSNIDTSQFVPEEFVEDIADKTTDPLVMVVFISLTPPQATIDSIDFEFDASTFSSLTKVIHPKDEIDYDGEVNPLLTINKSNSSETGFQGSLASIGKDGDAGDKSTKPALSDVSGQLSSPFGSALHHSLGQSLSLSGDTSLLTSNGNLIGTYQLSPHVNPLFTSATATGTHPATQLVAMMIEKAATGSDKAKQELSVQLDPPELGRMQIHLSMEKGETMKVHLIAEKQETLTLLQRDSHILKSALDNAGIQTDGSSLSFDLSSNNQSFNQLLGGQQQDGQSARNLHFAVNADGSVISEHDMRFIETQMNFIPDKVTGNIHYSLLV
jgi:hypothetical protein